ncbi:MAG: LysM peptidoglycan-binding domain-containing protein [Anaerolineaceae bacterium]|nr:LysM peptidoglycan-binding domain-containing protein [Anaerolineaceae bacterium]
MYLIILIASLGLVWLQTAPIIRAAANPAVSAAVTAYELIDAVNQLRASNGLNTLGADNALMVAAQSHSEYQAYLGYWTHEGSGGSNETDRAIAAGYGGGSQVLCDEAVAIASADKNADYLIGTLWNDYIHRDVVLLNNRYVHIGTGVAQGSDGRYYYTVDVCVSGAGGQSAVQATSNAADQSQSTSPVTNATKAPFATVTPREDGSIWHEVRPGETMWDIAIAYGKTVLDLATMNGISPSDPTVYVGQVLLIQGAPTATITPTFTLTPLPPTQTPYPTRTPRPTRVRLTATITPTMSPTPEPSLLDDLKNVEQRAWGLMILIVSILGLLLMIGIKPILQLKDRWVELKNHPPAPETDETEEATMDENHTDEEMPGGEDEPTEAAQDDSIRPEGKA